MKKLILGLVLGLLLLSISPAGAQVRVRAVFPLPPPIVFAQPPEMVVLPDTEVYVAPEVDADIFFYGGFWFRLWEGRWYRSLYYDRGWGFYRGVPGWYGSVYPGWRDNYRSGMWGGHPWEHNRIPYNHFHNNWKTWHNSGHYKNNWGTQGHHEGYGKGTHQNLNKGTHQNLNKGMGTHQNLNKGMGTHQNLNKGMGTHQGGAVQHQGGAGTPHGEKK